MTIIRCNFESVLRSDGHLVGRGALRYGPLASKATGRDRLDDLKARFKDLLARALEFLEYVGEVAHCLTVRFKCFRFQNKPKGIV